MAYTDLPAFVAQLRRRRGPNEVLGAIRQHTRHTRSMGEGGGNAGGPHPQLHAYPHRQSDEDHGAWLSGHRAWIKSGFDDGVFLLVCSLQRNAGGAILAHNAALEEIEARVQGDPFVIEGVVSAEILDAAPGRTNGASFLEPET